MATPAQTAAEGPRRITVLDLNADQTAQLEAKCGITAQRMGNDPAVSVFDILRHLLVVSGRRTEDEAAAMSNRQCMAEAAIDEDEDPKARRTSKRTP